MSANPEYDRIVAAAVLRKFADQLTPLGLPFLFLICLPDEGASESSVARCSGGLTDYRNRAFMRAQFDKYMADWDAGKIAPNQKGAGPW